MKKTLILLSILTSFLASAQSIEINPNGGTNASAILDLKSTTKGFLLPRMTNEQMRAISSPAQGLLAFCTDCGTNGDYYFYKGTNWVALGSTTVSVSTTVGSVSANANENGATITSGGVLNLAPANASNPGIVTKNAQTFGGEKTFSNGIVGNVIGNASTATTAITATNISGGAAGSIPYQTGTGLTSLLAAGSSGQVLTSTGLGPLTWASPSAGYNVFTKTTTITDPFDIEFVGGDTFLNNLWESNTLTGQNFSNGLNTLPDNSTNIGIGNVGIGINVLPLNTNGSGNTGLGFKSLSNNTTGSNNAAFGTFGLYSNNIGSYNSAFGSLALASNTVGSNNTAIGEHSLAFNTTGSVNTATGVQSLQKNTTGYSNTAIGHFSLGENTTGYANTSIGEGALDVNTTGLNNTAIGSFSNVATGSLSNATAIGYFAIVAASNTIQLGSTQVTDVKTSGRLTAGTVTYPNTHNSTAGQVLITDAAGVASWATPSAGYNVFTKTTTNTDPFDIGNSTNFNGDAFLNNLWESNTLTGQNFSNGLNTLPDNSTNIGIGNVGIGINVMPLNTNGSGNTGLGFKSLSNNTTGSNNAAFGTFALYSNNTGTANSAFGNLSLTSNTTGTANSAFGEAILINNTTGNFNTGFGVNALRKNITGDFNTAIGMNSLALNETGSKNTAIGFSANVASPDLTNAIAIGYDATVAASNTIQLGNTSVTDVKTSGTITAGEVTYPKNHGGNGDFLTSTGSGTLEWTQPVFRTTLVREVADELNATQSGQTNFILSQIKSGNSTIKMYINGSRVSNAAYSVNGSILTYTPEMNAGYSIKIGDRVQFDYYY